MADLAVSGKERPTALAVGVAAASRPFKMSEVFPKLPDSNINLLKPKAAPLKFAPPKLAPFPKTPRLGGPMPNLSGGPISLAPSPAAGGILSAFFPLAILAMLATALREMVGKILKPNKQLAPAH